MKLDKRIQQQMKRIEALQKDLIGRSASAEDAKRPQEMKRERAATVRESIDALQRDKKQTIARFDAEIAAREAELVMLEQKSEVDLTLQQSGGARPKKPRSKAPAKRPRKKSPATK